ncbi:MAG: hypothetical protein WBG86_15460 [Polyangiales bacterium]
MATKDQSHRRRSRASRLHLDPHFFSPGGARGRRTRSPGRAWIECDITLADVLEDLNYGR